MKKLLNNRRNLYFLLFLEVTLILLGDNCFGQASTPFNIGTTGDFLGWDATVNSDVLIRHNTPGQPIIFRTGGIERMRFEGDANQSFMINTTNPNGARMSVLETAPSSNSGVVRGMLDNPNLDPINRGLWVQLSAPYQTNNIVGIIGESFALTNTFDLGIAVTALAGRANYGFYGVAA